MKITKEQTEKGQEVYQKLVQMSWKDNSFKERLLSDPKNTIEGVMGRGISINSKIVVEDQSDESIIFFNIPRQIDIDDYELAEEELEMVSGGWWSYIAVAAAIYDFGSGFMDEVNAQWK